MKIQNLSSYSREQLVDVLRILKLYKTSLVQIGHRTRLIDPKGYNRPQVRIEYPEGINPQSLQDFISKILGDVFFLNDIPEDIVYVSSSTLIGGVRIFVGEDMVNVSFQKFAQQITAV